MIGITPTLRHGGGGDTPLVVALTVEAGGFG